MSRSIWKGPHIDLCFFKSKFYNKISPPRIWSRRSVILSSFMDQIVFIHNGKFFKKMFITREKVGFKFGDFVFTRTHTVKKKKLIKKKKK